MTKTRVARLKESNINDAADVVARAFFDDPLERYMLPDDRARLKASSARFRNVLRYGHLFGEVYTTRESLGAAAMWLPPGETEMSDERMEQAGMFELQAIVGQEAFSRFIPVIDVFDGLHASDAPGRHWYLLVIGVDPSRQRTGLGRALIDPMLARADAERRSVLPGDSERDECYVLHAPRLRYHPRHRRARQRTPLVDLQA